MAHLHRPEPRLSHQAQPVDRHTPPQRAAARLCDGQDLLITDAYDTGLAILAQIDAMLPAPAEGAGYPARREHRRRQREITRRLLTPIHDHRVALEGSPECGFLRLLYPELSRFALPFAQAQQLCEAWTWYRRGVHLAVLGYRVHPFFGTYVPSRVSHLELFGTWLAQHRGTRGRAVDVGTGCGVLALMLCKAGFERVLATDINPNAIESVRRQLGRLDPRPPLDLLHGDLLGDDPTPADLIAFNPPWMQGEVEGLLDAALYFEPGLFERFFDQAAGRLAPDGRVVLVFSSLIQLVQPDTPHPILTELERGRFELVSKLHRRAAPSANKTTGRRRRTRERVEIWELALA
jgi:SAM-dependent methyltransferase